MPLSTAALSFDAPFSLDATLMNIRNLRSTIRGELQKIQVFSKHLHSSPSLSSKVTDFGKN